MSCEEFLENLVYSAAMSVTVPNRAAPEALAWASERLRARYGSQQFDMMVSIRSLGRAVRAAQEKMLAAVLGQSSFEPRRAR